MKFDKINSINEILFNLFDLKKIIYLILFRLKEMLYIYINRMSQKNQIYQINQEMANEEEKQQYQEYINSINETDLDYLSTKEELTYGYKNYIKCQESVENSKRRMNEYNDCLIILYEYTKKYETDIKNINQKFKEQTRNIILIKITA